jgi:hypothetical protein
MQPKTENVKPKTRPLFEGKMSGESPPKKYPQSAFPDSPYLEAVRKGLRIRMGRTPAEIAEVYGRREKGPTSEPFSTTALVN